jgi:RimJ/RimL family protein N-acetyltransferase
LAERLTESLYFRAVQPIDHDQLYEWFTDLSVARTWRYRGRTPDPESFVSHLWAGVYAHFMFCVRGQELPVGYGSIYDVSFSARNAKLAILIAPELRHGSFAYHCFFKLALFAFEQWPLDKLLMECNTYSLSQFESGLHRGLFVEEARIRDYECFGDDQWADLVWISASRRDVREYADANIRSAGKVAPTNERLASATAADRA